ncbi:MAG: choice-of-anchor D domain-containing protein, partial [Thermomicrobia bacterium]|nr:choice-of-anchor D domain-containing protein [Thermomicrobia bacterium]
TYTGVGSPQTVQLHGNGVAPGASLTLQTACPDTHVTVSATCQALLRNTGNADLTITTITLASTTSAFSIPNGACGSTLGQGASCGIPITFLPPVNGSYTAVITVNDNAVGSPHSVTVTGNGVGGAPVATLSSTSLVCAPSATILTTCSPVITITNTGTAVLVIAKTEILPSLSPSQPYSIPANACVKSLNPAETCQITVSAATFVGTAPTVTLTITDNAPVANSTQTVTIKPS